MRNIQRVQHAAAQRRAVFRVGQRELDERLGLTGLIQNHLVDSRTGRNTQFPLADLFRQSAYSRLAGHEDLNDATRLASDPTFRLMGSQKVWERGVALTSTLHWFETDLLAREENLTGLARLNRELVARAEGVGSPHRVVLDMDSSESSNSPFFRLMEHDRFVLLLGVGLSSLTNSHAGKDIRNVPYLSAIDAARRHATYTSIGRRI